MKQTVKGHLTDMEKITQMELKCIESGLDSDITAMNLFTRRALGEIIFTYKDTEKKFYNKLEQETNNICDLVMQGYLVGNAMRKLGLNSTTYNIEANDSQKLKVKLAKKQAIKIHGNSGLRELNINQ